MKIWRGFLLIAIATLGALAVADAPAPVAAGSAPEYVLHDLGLSGDDEPSDINSHQDICGNVDVELAGGIVLQQAFAILNGHRVLLQGPAHPQARAWALNDQGQIVGAGLTNGGWRAFFWQDANADGTIDPFDDDETINLGAANGTTSVAYDINNRGQVTGEVFRRSVTFRAFRWERGQPLRLLPMSGAVRSSATWIGADGTIIGTAAPRRSTFRPMIWKPGKRGKFIPLNSPFASSAVTGRSAGGDIWLNLAGGITPYHPFVLHKGKKKATPLASGGTSGYVGAVNQPGEAVGHATLTMLDDEGNEVTETWPMYWHGKSAYDVNELLPTGSGFQILTADSINNAGWILTLAVDQETKNHLVLLEPPAR